MNDRSAGAVVTLLLKRFHASDTLVGLLMGSLQAALVILIAPVVSYKSDRLNSRWGRRIPFILVPTPFIVIGLVAMAFSPEIGRLLYQVLNRWLGSRSPDSDECTLLFIGAAWVLLQMAATVMNSILGALINDVVPAEVLGRFFAAMRALSLLVGIVFFRWVLKAADADYAWIFLGVAAIYGFGVTLMCFKVKEGAPPPVVMDVGRDTGSLFKSIRTYFEECYSIPYYRLFYAFTALAQQCIIPINLFTIFFVKSIQMDLQTFGDCIALTYVISFVLSYPLGALADRFHPLRVSLGVLFLYATVTLLGGLFIHDTTTFFIALLAHGIVAGMWYSTSASIGQRLLPKANFAQLGSACWVVISLCAIAVGLASGGLLDHVFNHLYRVTYLFSSLMAIVAIILGLRLPARFMELGGPAAYVAPERLNKKMPGLL
jgi:MFS family permease